MQTCSEIFPYVDSEQLFEKVAKLDWALFLDSGMHNKAEPCAENARYDVLACCPTTTLVTRGEQTEVMTNGVNEIQTGNPIDLLKNQLNTLKIPQGDTDSVDTAYGCGAYGYFSYDLARTFERLPEIAEDDERLPEMAVGIYQVVVVVDHVKKQTVLVNHGDDFTALISFWQEAILQTAKCKSPILRKCRQWLRKRRRLKSKSLLENMDWQEYQQRFNQVQNYITEGDCYQVNLTKRFSAAVKGDPWITYCQLRKSSSAPYGAYLKLPFASVLSNSPESFLRCYGQRVVTSPIKGTMPRSSDPVKDQLNKQALLNSVKDKAENLMIVDLMRNDLSRCCEANSVQVPAMFEVHSFANVHHLISKITGKLKHGLHSLDLLQSCFPGGSITGAPKIRAMQIIEELEPHRRGLYCGSIGYVGINGDMQTNIAIRTIVVKEGVARFSAGGGLVVDSNVESEYQELIDKAKMMREAIAP